jgi:hypothetical protein
LTKAIRLPSGDQTGSVSAPTASVVTFVGALPSAFTTKMSDSPVRALSNATFPAPPG